MASYHVHSPWFIFKDCVKMKENRINVLLVSMKSDEAENVKKCIEKAIASYYDSLEKANNEDVKEHP